MVVPDGFEPPQAEPKSAVLPLDEGTIKSGKQGSNLRPRTWKERALPTELLPQKKEMVDPGPASRSRRYGRVLLKVYQVLVDLVGFEPTTNGL